MAKKAPAWAAQKLKEAEAKSSGGGDFVTLNDGANYVRILPSWRGEDEQFYKEGAQHYKIGPAGKTVACARVFGKKCFLCEENDRLFKSGDKEAAKKLRAKARYYANAVVLTEKEKVVKTFAFGSTILKSLLRFLVDVDDEWGEWWNDDNRYDFKIEKSGQELDTEYNVVPTRKFKDVDTSDCEPRDLDALAGQPMTYAQMKALYEGEDPEAVEDDEETDEEESPKSKKRGKKVEEDEESDDTETDEDEKSDDDESEEGDEDEEKSDDDEEEKDEDESDETEDDEPEAPECFEDPMEHDPENEVCDGCDWKDECRSAVDKKVKKDPKKYKLAPVVKLSSKKSGKVEEQLKKAVAGKKKR